jgi:hypothetical protein
MLVAFYALLDSSYFVKLSKRESLQHADFYVLFCIDWDMRNENLVNVDISVRIINSDSGHSLSLLYTMESP